MRKIGSRQDVRRLDQMHAHVEGGGVVVAHTAAHVVPCAYADMQTAAMAAKVIFLNYCALLKWCPRHEAVRGRTIFWKYNTSPLFRNDEGVSSERNSRRVRSPKGCAVRSEDDVRD